MAINPICTICLTDLESTDTVYKFPCNETHRIHQACFERWENSTRNENKDIMTFPCPLCRGITQLPLVGKEAEEDRHARKILMWEKEAIRINSFVFAILGSSLTIRILAHPYVKEMFSANDAWLGILAKKALPVIVGVAASIGATLACNINSAWKEKVILRVYNKILGTQITSTSIMRHRIHSISDPETRMSILFLYAIYFNVRLIKTSMERASFTYEDQALAQSIITELDNLENEKFADTVRRHLQSEDAALYTDISQLEEALTKTDLSDESQETKSKLYKFILKSITSTLKEKLPLTNTPQSMARLIAVRAIGMQDGMFSENPEKKNHWLTCLKALQSECNDSTSPLITEFLEFRFTDNTNLFQSLSAGCFFELLCDPNLANPFCLSLYKKMTLQKPNTYLFPSHLQD